MIEFWATRDFEDAEYDAAWCVVLRTRNRYERLAPQRFSDLFVVEFQTTTGHAVATYYASTVLGLDAYGSGTGGLMLDAGSRGAVGAETMDAVRDWMRDHLDTLALDAGGVA